MVGPSHDNEVTWSPGQEFDLAPNDKMESDFILWYQRKELLGNDHPTEVIFGEVKSFGRENRGEKNTVKDVFQDSDVARLKKLAIRFPGSIFAFATMKEASHLSKDEIARLAGFANWGREYIDERQKTRAPVIVLTGTELFASYSLRLAWEKVGGRHAEFAKAGWVRTENLRVLADLTQQLYLNMPSYHAWSEQKWKKRMLESAEKQFPPKKSEKDDSVQ